VLPRVVSNSSIVALAPNLVASSTVCQTGSRKGRLLTRSMRRVGGSSFPTCTSKPWRLMVPSPLMPGKSIKSIHLSLLLTGPEALVSRIAIRSCIPRPAAFNLSILAGLLARTLYLEKKIKRTTDSIASCLENLNKQCREARLVHATTCLHKLPNQAL